MKINSLFLDFLKFFPTKVAYAHCDIPCGIYDPHMAQMASHTVIRMTQMLNDLTAEKDIPFEERKKIIHQIARLTKVKEEHAELVKHEIRVLWADYFKEEHLKKYPDLHSLIFKILKLASKARQEINMDAANELLENVQKMAEIFFETKGLKSVRVKSPYPTGGEIVLQDVRRPQ
ncbi:MAG: superoxide dismutase, Ni [Candidatus Levybacteria bacterium]|nr:superoxide dismutase, Ni [Candidatus Levybacteria bacterium]